MHNIILTYKTVSIWNMKDKVECWQLVKNIWRRKKTIWAKPFSPRLRSAETPSKGRHWVTGGNGFLGFNYAVEDPSLPVWRLNGTDAAFFQVKWMNINIHYENFRTKTCLTSGEWKSSVFSIIIILEMRERERERVYFQNITLCTFIDR